ncbi:MAG: hypothetical protein QOD56_1386, partial [Gammaproteobacteria bacterium]|nr:hypothetical protein [Gammaproteobacteria bacterium]
MESKLKVAAKTRSTGSVATAAKTTDKAPGRTEASELDLPELLAALHAMRAGDFSVRLSGSHTGVAGKICDTFNT